MADGDWEIKIRALGNVVLIGVVCPSIDEAEALFAGIAADIRAKGEINLQIAGDKAIITDLPAGTTLQ